MRKVFFLLMATMMLYNMSAADDNKLSLDNVKLAAGGTANVSVKLDNAKEFVAFQFDMALPAGVTVTDASLNADRKDGHQFEWGVVDGKYRFLAYSMNNNALKNASGEIVNLTLAAGNAVSEGGQITIDSEIFVTGDAEGTELANVTADIENLPEYDVVTIGNGGNGTHVSKYDLDFSGLDDVKAYIATGYDLDEDMLWLTRVTDVPAGTPIIVMGPSGSKEVPVGQSTTYYGENFLRGNAYEAETIDRTAGYTNLAYSSSTGNLLPIPESMSTFTVGKAYVHFRSTVSSSVGNNISLNLAVGNGQTLVSSYDLDFTGIDDVKAFIVTGYDKSGTIWLTRVQKVSAGTPLIINCSGGEAPYVVPSSAVHADYANMLRGSATEATSLEKVVGDYTNFGYSLSKSQFVPFPDGKTTTINAGSAYLPLLTSYISASSGARGFNARNTGANAVQEAEVIGIKVGSLIGDATGINAIEESETSDDWYNLQGQKVDTPTKKGLYIKNGKKVIVK